MNTQEAKEKLKDEKMREALYDMMWREAHKNDRNPMPTPTISRLDGRNHETEELKRILGTNGPSKVYIVALLAAFLIIAVLLVMTNI